MTLTASPRARTFGRRAAVALGSAALAVAGLALPAVAGSVAPHVAASNGFTVDQARLLDTRVDQPTGPISGFTTVQVTTDVPSGTTVEMTVTTTQSSGTGFVTAYPSGSAAPSTSNVNYAAGTTFSSAVDVLVPPDGTIDLNVSGAATQLIVDQQGYFAASALTGIAPQRIADSRSGMGLAMGPQSGTVTLPIPTSAVPAGSGVVALNVTVTGASGPGNVVAYSGGTVPASSSVNYEMPTDTASNLVYVTPTAGNVSFTVRGAPVNIVVDVFGYAPSGSTFTAATAQRVADSRVPSGLPKGPLKGAQTVTLTAAQVPAGTTAVALNVTATQGTGEGYVVAYPTGSTQPATSELQFSAGRTTAQTVVVPVGTNNQVTLFVGGTGPTQLVVDYEGAVGAGS